MPLRLRIDRQALLGAWLSKRYDVTAMTLTGMEWAMSIRWTTSGMGFTQKTY
jgi:hypothetical protein